MHNTITKQHNEPRTRHLRVVFGVLALFISLFLFNIQSAEAAVSHLASSESHTGSTGSASESSFSWTHGSAGHTPEGVIVFVTTLIGFDNYVTSVTYGGETMTYLGEGYDITDESATVSAYFLGKNVPTGAQTIQVNRTNNAVTMYAQAATVDAGADTRAVGATIAINNGTYSEVSIDDGSPGEDSLRYAAGFSGASSYSSTYSGSLFSPGTNSTHLQSIDFGNFVTAMVRETTAGQGSRPVGFEYSTSDDRAAVYVAIREETEQIFHLSNSESHQNGSSTNESSFNWSHGSTGDAPEGILVFVTTLADADYITSVTYNGTPLVQVGEARDTTGGPGRLTTFFLGKNVPTGSKTIQVSRTNNATPMYASAASIDYMLNDGAVLETTDVTIQNESGSLAEQNIDDGSQSSVPTLRYAGVYSGLDSTPSSGANSTILQDNDFGTESSSMVVEESAGTGSRPVGWSASSDDRAAVYLAVRPQQPSVTHVDSSESSVSQSQDSFSWSHGSGGDAPEGVLVFVETLSGINDYITSVTFGGVPMTEIGQAQDSSGESTFMTAFFLGSGVPSGNQTIQVNRTNNTAQMKGYSVSVDTPDGEDTEAVDVTLLQNDGTLSEQNIDDGLTLGVQSLRYAALHSGLEDAPSPGSNSYELENHDYGLETSALVSEINPGLGNRPVGWSSGTPDDRAAVFVAVRATTSTSYGGAGAYTYTVPEGVYNIEIKAWGAGGGGGGGGTVSGGGAGGGGGFASGTIAVTPGQQIGVTIGAGGDPGDWSGATNLSGEGGGGGGYSIATTSSGTLIIAAGGGGGGGGDNGTGAAAGGAGGAGGGTTGVTGGASDNALGGGGGTSSGGGSGGTGGVESGQSGSSLSGGDGAATTATWGGGGIGGGPGGGDGASVACAGCAGGGGGGSGYYGGGGGSSYVSGQDGGGGGGGGSSYATTSATDARLVSGSGTNAANDTDPNYVGSFGDGGSAGATSGNGTAGNDGYVVITALEGVPSITLSGTLYSDEGVTPIDPTKTIKVVVGTSTPSVHTTTTNGSGAWTLDVSDANLFVSMPILAWVDGDSVKASHFTKASSTANDIPNLDLYQNRVIISHEGTSGTSTTNSDLSFYDGDNDTDIQYTSNSGTLSVRTGNELHIKTGKTFAPGGAVTIHGNAGSGTDGSLHLADSSTYTAGATTTIAGNLSASSTATWTPGSYTTTFTATTTGKSIIFQDVSPALGNIEFDGVGGAWSFTNSNATTSDFTITNGTVTAPSGVLTIQGDYSNSGVFTHNSGLVRMSGQGWTNLESATYDSNPLSIGSQETYPGGVFFKPDGTKMYVGSIIDGDIHQYTLSTPWVVTSGSASFDGTFSASAYGLNAMESHFSPDGTKMFVLMGGGGKGQVITFTLSTPWVITSGVSYTERYNISTQQSSPYGFTFKSDGTKLYVTGSSGDDIDSYTLSSPWVVSTSSIAVEGTPFAVSTQDSSPSALAFNPDGTKLYVLGFGTDSVRSYSLSTPWEVSGSSATHDGALFSVNDGFAYGLYIKPDARKVFVTGTDFDYVFTYDVEGATSTLSGTMTGTSALNDFEAESSTIFSNNASTSDITIDSNAFVEMPSYLSVTGNFTNNGEFDDNAGTVIFDGTTQTLTGTLLGQYADMHKTIFRNSGTKTYSVVYAQVLDMSIDSGATVVAPSDTLFIAGDYTNLGNFTDNSGTVHFNGGAQTIGGFMNSSSNDFSHVIFGGSGTKDIENVIQTQNFTINSGVTVQVYADTYIIGNYTNNGSLTSSGQTFRFTGTTQSLNGQMTGSTGQFGNMVFSGGTKTFNANASSSGTFTINSGATVVAPSYLSIGGGYTNNGDFTDNSGTVIFSGGSQTISGQLTGTADDFNNVIFGGSSTKTISSNASTTNFTINSGATVSTPTYLTISGNYTNNGNITTTNDTIHFNGTTQSLNGQMTGTSDDLHHVIFGGSGTKTFNASADLQGNFTINSGVTATAPSVLTIYGNYTNNGNFADSSGTVNFDGGSQSLNGDMYSIFDEFYTVTFGGSGTKTFNANAAATNFTIDSGVTVSAPSVLNIYGTYTNNGDFTSNTGTINFDGDAQSINGQMTGTSDDFYSITFGGNGIKTFGGNVDTQSLTIDSGATFSAPTLLNIGSNYLNNGTFTHNSGTTTFNGTGSQYISGTLTGSSAFNNVSITNNTATTTFGSAVTVSGHFAALQPNTQLAFASNATTTLNTVRMVGTSGNEVHLRSTTAGQQHTLDVNSTYSFAYVDLKDSNACPSGTLIAYDSIDSTGNTCWQFGAPEFSSGANHHFYVGQATTTLPTATSTLSATAANDIRIHIPSETNFKFDANTTSLTFGGTASGKVSGTVSYEDNNTTLVINVTSNLTSDDTLTISGIKVGNFAAISTSAGNFELHTDGNIAGDPAATDPFTINITGSLTVSDHSAGQVDNVFSFQNQTDAPFFAFNLAAAGEDSNIADIVITLSGIDDLDTSDITNLKLYRDANSDGALDGGDVLIDGNGILTMNGQEGAITFNTDWTATSSQSANYLVTGNTVSIPNGSSVVFKLLTTGITATGGVSNYDSYVISTVSSVQHSRNNSGGGGSSASIGGAPPPGDSVETGGEESGGGELGEDDGENIAFDPDFKKPTSTGAPDNQWTNPTNAYNSDGVYATETTNTERQTYYGFNLNVPGSNTIQGIEVKLDASGSTAAGTLGVALSWNSGTSWTVTKTTPTLGTSDVVYTVGGPSDTWGRSWTPAEIDSSTFRIRITGNTSSNTLRLDALEVRVYHQAGGGGQGGGSQGGAI